MSNQLTLFGNNGLFSSLFDYGSHPFDSLRWPADELGISKNHQYPKISLENTETETIIKATVPGVPKEDVSVTIDGDYISISGKSQNKKEDKTSNYTINEIHKSSFSRMLHLGKEHDTNNITASIDNGILTIKVPKKEPTNNVKQISIS